MFNQQWIMLKNLIAYVVAIDTGLGFILMKIHSGGVLYVMGLCQMTVNIANKRSGMFPLTPVCSDGRLDDTDVPEQEAEPL